MRGKALAVFNPLKKKVLVKLGFRGSRKLREFREFRKFRDCEDAGRVGPLGGGPTGI
jgi:hypothetical protein